MKKAFQLSVVLGLMLLALLDILVSSLIIENPKEKRRLRVNLREAHSALVAARQVYDIEI